MKTLRQGTLLALFSLSCLAAGAADYYVAPSGSDSNPGTLSQPWRTLEHANERVQPGDTVHVRAGTYADVIEPFVSGSRGRPITYKNYQDEEVTIEGIPGVYRIVAIGWKVRGNWGQRDYIVVEGFDVRFKEIPGSDRDVVSNFFVHGDHNIIRNNKIVNHGDVIAEADFYNVRESGINLDGDYNLIEHNYIKGMLSQAIGCSGRFNIARNNVIVGTHGNAFMVGSAKGTIQGHLFERNLMIGSRLSDGVQSNGDFSLPPEELALDTSTRGFVIRNNVVWGNAENGIDLKGSSDMVVENNIIYANIADNDGPVDGHQRGMAGGVMRGSGQSSKDLIVRNNVIYDNCGGIRQDDGYTMYNNTILNNTHDYTGPNSSYRHSSRPNFVGICGWGSGQAIKNNILGDHPIVELAIFRSGIKQDVDGNCYFHTYATPQFAINYVSDGDWDQASFTQWQAYLQTQPNAGGREEHSMLTDPRFVNVPGRITGFHEQYDFRLRPDSPAIDAGVPLTRTVGAGSGLTLQLAHARYFFDGYGIVKGDRIQLAGAPETARIVAIDYSNDTIIVDAPLDWADGQGVSLTHDGTAPDIGAPYDPFGVRVLAGTDDAEERLDTSAVSLGSSDLELGRDAAEQLVGVRFTNVRIPHGARILWAYVQFAVDETGAESSSFQVCGEDADNASGFAAETGNLSGRPATAASVPWAPRSWNVVGEAGPRQRTPDIAAVLQEIVDRPGWQPGNALALFVSGAGKRVAESCDGDPARAPALYFEYNAEGTFMAYNDLAWAPGQRSTHITTYTRGQAGHLTDHADGKPVRAVLSVSNGGGGPSPDRGAEPAEGTDADKLFRGILDTTGVIDYGTEELVLTFSELDPALRYTVALYGNRDVTQYTDRQTACTISGATRFRNTSTYGANFAGAADPTTHIVNGYNTQNGYVARFTAIEPGPDGTFQIAVGGGSAKSYVNAVMLEAALPERTAALIPPNTTWRYHAQGTDLGTAWRNSTYADSGWAQGYGALGYGESWIMTGIPFGSDPDNKPTTAYFRRRFHVEPYLANPTAMLLRVRYDDGFVAYLNGQELLRRSMPAGTVGYSTRANAHEGDRYEAIDLSAYAGRLLPGENVLAVEVHQNAADSSDLTFDLSLHVGGQSEPPPAAPANLRARAVSSTSIALSWQDNSSDETGFRLERRESGTSEWVQLGDFPANTTTRTDTGLTPATKFYYTVRAVRGSDLSDRSELSDATTPDGTAPGARWRYRKGTAEASNPPTAWRKPGFDDSVWPEGPAPFGYGDGPYGTELTDMKGLYSCLFLRRAFQVENPAAVSALELELLYDDGFIVWLNGQEVARRNMNGTPGTFNPCSDTANAGVGDGTAWNKTLTGAELPVLLPGPNALAVQVFNVSLADSSDLTADAVLSLVMSRWSLAEDADQDGMPDNWEEAHLSDLSDPSDRSDQGDPDNDGLSNLEEYIAGTDPRLETGNWKLETQLNNGWLEVRFDALAASGPGYEGKTRHYALESRQADAAHWQIVPGHADLIAAGQTVTYAPPSDESATLYRARVWLE